MSRRDNQTISRQNSACVIVPPRQSSLRRDRQKAILIVAAFPSRLSRYIEMQFKLIWALNITAAQFFEMPE